MIRRIRTGMLLASLSAVAFAGTACTSERERRMEDARLAQRVMEELQDARDLDTSRVNVQAKGHLVQLSGFVDTDDEKERAEEIAEDVKGVKDVENDLIVD
ncbi:MAG: BON domain-containing protein [Rhodospirillales bacterium]|nr:BON domain-containing protein [Rhodospirillales bacterium]